LAELLHIPKSIMQSPVGTIFPVILSGGSGSRLWPLSRSSYPKQFLPLCSDLPMLAETVRRIARPGFAQPTIICSHTHRFLVAQSLTQAGVTPRGILLEPEGRNTGIAVALAASWLLAQDGDALMLIMPSDHVIGDLAALHAAVGKASAAAETGLIVTLGVAPSRPDTGYGYIKQGDPIEGLDGARRIAQFVEKPDLPTAQAYIASGAFNWNAGIFIARADTLIAEFRQHAPDILASAEAALAESVSDLDFIRLGEAAFTAAQSIGFDHAIMEKTGRGCVVAVDMNWSDIGSWRALWENGVKDDRGNVVAGDTWLQNTSNSLIHTADGLLTAVIGLDDIVVIATDDAILVADKKRAEDVKILVEALVSKGRQEHLHASVVHRPWGSYRTLEGGDGYLVKRITVNPKASLSLQYHHHRAEHWIVVDGIAKVTRGNTTFLLQRNESTYIPIGETHRLENPGDSPLHLIEVQSGATITEEDIVRLDDNYGRQSPAAGNMVKA
jgi:mannose-1-phosphate guanylyltransferase/mannose-6-phosphate isomerase